MDGDGAQHVLDDPTGAAPALAGGAARVRLRLMNDEVRHVVLGSRTGSIGNALDRLEDWIETEEGSWVQKRWIVEVTGARSPEAGTW